VTQRQAGESGVQTVGSAIGGTLMPPRTLPEDRTGVSINFDDGLTRQKAAADALAARGLRGTFYVNSGTIGKSGYLSWNDLASMQTVGHEIGSHTQHHPDLRTLTPDQQRTEICGDRNALVSKGLTITSFAYPSSWWTDELQSVVAGCGGFETARTVGGIQCTACTYAETQPPGNRWVVDTADQVLSGTSLSTLQRYVTTVESLGGGWVPVVFHDICDGCGAYGYSSATFTAFLDWLKTRPSTTVVRTMREAMAGADVTAPTVSVTAPTYTSRRSKVTLKAAATDSGSGVARVTFLVDGAVLATDTTSPYSATWDPKNARLGWHDVAARVDDRAGNTATSRTVRVYVSF
jgi:peptidoglycan/xylan/chitin deacetylase (PgdA/CDA1 family)